MSACSLGIPEKRAGGVGDLGLGRAVSEPQDQEFLLRVRVRAPKRSRMDKIF
jgi:hypothetical protein